MNINKKWLFTALLALVVPLVFTGNTGAIYLGDGAVQNGVTGGWDLPVDKGKCVTGIAANGSLIIDNTITSRADCIAKVFPAYATKAACGNAANADGAHWWTKSCVDGSGNGISLTGLDRTSAMCTAKGGTWKDACTSSWQYAGADGLYDDGFCYATANVTTAYGTQALCPTTTFGYSWDATNSKCTFSYGIAGYANAAIKNLADATVVAAGASFDASAYTTMGVCLLNGFSWNNYTAKSGTSSVATTPAPTTAATVTGASTDQCLRCHTTTSQYNSYAERWKQDYLKTGHKNMLRKVTQGMNWAGPNENGVLEVYTSWGTGGANAIDWITGTTTISGTSYPLLYIFGDWMAPAPAGLDVVNWKGTTAGYNNGNAYSCASCHTTGWRDENTAKGLCSISSKTTSADCATAGGTWYPSSGVQGYGMGGAEPMASYPAYASGSPLAIPGITGQWDRDGINCSRCHASTFPAVYDGTTAVTATHHGSLEGTGITNLCYGCHQSVAKTSTGTGAGNGLDADLSHPEYIPVKDSDSGAAYVPEFSGHVLGGEFLNSPHGKFTGTITPNKLGKYDIAGGTYASAFKGYNCYASATSATIYSTIIKNGQVEKVANQTDCTSVGGTWRAETQGNCSTCHNVHESLFVADAQEPLKRECQTCHGQKTIGYNMGNITCEDCHMPKATASGFPMHLWRINTDSNYSTFPTAAEFTDATNAKKIANMSPDNSGYANAVWVDVDLACGKCHGTSGTDRYLTKAQAAAAAVDMHGTPIPPPPIPVMPTAKFKLMVSQTTDRRVDLDATPSTNEDSYAWSFTGAGVCNPVDGTTLTSAVLKCDFTVKGVYMATLTVTNASSGLTNTRVSPVYAIEKHMAPTATIGSSVDVNTNIATITVTGGSADIVKVFIDWNDGQGTSDTTAPFDSYTHTYGSEATYYASVTLVDSLGFRTTYKVALTTK